MKFASKLALLFVLCASPVFGQAIQQAGPVTPGDPFAVAGNGFAMDGGPSTDGQINQLGVTALGNPKPFCVQDVHHTTPYRQLCLGISSTQAYITLDSYNGAANLPFNFVLNGINYPFPSGGSGLGGIRVISTAVTSDAMNAGDVNGTIAWNSSAAANKNETLLACNPASNGNRITIADQAATASSYPILLTATSGTIAGQASYIMVFARSSNTFQCDAAATDWVPL